eukprot:2914102-Prymnesium_polylepis.2
MKAVLLDGVGGASNRRGGWRVDERDPRRQVERHSHLRRPAHFTRAPSASRPLPAPVMQKPARIRLGMLSGDRIPDEVGCPVVVERREGARTVLDGASSTPRHKLTERGRRLGPGGTVESLLVVRQKDGVVPQRAPEAVVVLLTVHGDPLAVFDVIAGARRQ